MNGAVFLLTFSMVFALICGQPSNETEDTSSVPDISEACSERITDEIVKKACNGQLVSNLELKSTLDNNLKKIGVTKPKLHRRNDNEQDKDHIEDVVSILKIMKKQIKGAYVGVVKEADSLKKKIKPEEKETLDTYLKQLKIAYEFSMKKIEECIKKLKDEENKSSGGPLGGYSSGGGVTETVEPAIVNFGRQYDSIFEYMSEY